MLVLPFALLWQGRARYFVITMWTLGWVSIIGNLLSNEWWVVQNIGFPAATFLVACLSVAQESEGA